MLSEARSWLAHAVEATEPQTIDNFKAQMATNAEATKQLGLSKEIQRDAAEMVRRSEYGLGKVIRVGQEVGTIRAREHGGDRRSVSSSTCELETASPYDFAPHTVLYGDGREGGNGVYALAEASEEQFEEAITEARNEGNLSAPTSSARSRARRPA